MITTDPNPPTTRSGGLAGVVRRHPLLSFFLLANLLSWAAWTPYVLSQNGLGLWAFRFPEVLGTSQLLGMLPGAYLGPIFSAFLVTAVADGRAGLRRWVGRLWRWRVRWTWYAVALLGVPAVLTLAGLVFSGGDVRAPSVLVLVAYLPGLVLQLLTTGLAEEPGWRDFALPRLQDRFGPLGASLLLGPLWAVWHLPLFLTEWGGWPDLHWTRPLVFVLFCVSFNFVMSWVFNRTGQSLPLAMLTHVSVNNFSSIVWSEMFPALDADTTLLAQAVAAVAVAAVVLVGTRGRLGYRPDPQH
ncbi:CPBP family intramembrane metalloprotease [Desertihabitans brevis]|uniref:CPBP family intramembrane metalloprotease n=1 Tax=Desertihabitans brevis TaxID=2268447 RepID=A0A367YU98_9ACTN|nr:type II CAAX endopeptidase family protein [Desertihabitans brevis]RCK69337.1 CPBP family intramembrane metalloprotease [Desertihabitans brevis]